MQIVRLISMSVPVGQACALMGRTQPVDWEAKDPLAALWRHPELLISVADRRTICGACGTVLSIAISSLGAFET